MREISKEKKQQLFVINLERILSDKGMTKKDLAEKLHCTQQCISNYINRGVPEDVVTEISKALEVSEKDLYRTEAENEYYALKKINLEHAIFASKKASAYMLLGMLFLAYVMAVYKDGMVAIFACLVMLLFFEAIGALKTDKLIDRIFRVAMRSVEAIAVFVILFYPFLKG